MAFGKEKKNTTKQVQTKQPTKKVVDDKVILTPIKDGVGLNNPTPPTEGGFDALVTNYSHAEYDNIDNIDCTSTIYTNNNCNSLEIQQIEVPNGEYLLIDGDGKFLDKKLSFFEGQLMNNNEINVEPLTMDVMIEQIKKMIDSNLIGVDKGELGKRLQLLVDENPTNLVDILKKEISTLGEQEEELTKKIGDIEDMVQQKQTFETMVNSFMR